ncbi:MAG TPA: hypothetical protein VFE98_10010 [Candidatus Bathyarchaeia archaeon]|nr:hypothetical protein [Candidatus Bathyarchaeia archaeon]
MQTTGTESIDVGQLIRKIVESEVPLSEEESKFEAIKEKHTKGQALTLEEQDLVLKIAKKADEWEKDVESSALTEREETLPGC